MKNVLIKYPLGFFDAVTVYFIFLILRTNRFFIRGDILHNYKTIVVIILLLLILVYFIKVQMTKTTYEERVNSFLVDEQGYDKKEIKSIKVKWGFKLPSFYTIVIFEDEPFVEYIYFAHNGVKQFEYVLTEEGKERGIIESDLKHYVPLE